MALMMQKINNLALQLSTKNFDKIIKKKYRFLMSTISFLFRAKNKVTVKGRSLIHDNKKT